MVCMVVVHMTQVFLHAAYKFPRELNWLTGVLLLLLTLGMAFTGQVLRWDPTPTGASVSARRWPDGCRSLARASSICSGGSGHWQRDPEPVFRLARVRHPRAAADIPGGPSLAGAETGDQRPRAGKTVDPRTYQEEYEKELKKDGVPFFGEALWKDALFSS